MTEYVESSSGVWNSQLVSPGEKSNALKTYSYKDKTVFFLSDYSGVLYFETQEPDGTWQQFSNESITGGALTKLVFDGDFTDIRVFFVDTNEFFEDFESYTLSYDESGDSTVVGPGDWNARINRQNTDTHLHGGVDELFTYKGTLDNCESGWTAESSNNVDMIQPSTEWFVEGEGSLEIEGEKHKMNEYGQFSKDFDLTNIDSFTTTVGMNGKWQSSAGVEIKIGDNHEWRWSNNRDWNEVHEKTVEIDTTAYSGEHNVKFRIETEQGVGEPQSGAGDEVNNIGTAYFDWMRKSENPEKKSEDKVYRMTHLNSDTETGGAYFDLYDTFDLTSVDSLFFDADCSLLGDASLQVRIGGSVAWESSLGVNKTFDGKEIDISGYSGNNEVAFRLNLPAGTNQGSFVFWDDISLDIPDEPTLNSWYLEK